MRNRIFSLKTIIVLFFAIAFLMAVIALLYVITGHNYSTYLFFPVALSITLAILGYGLLKRSEIIRKITLVLFLFNIIALIIDDIFINNIWEVLENNTNFDGLDFMGTIAAILFNIFVVMVLTNKDTKTEFTPNKSPQSTPQSGAPEL